MNQFLRITFLLAAGITIGLPLPFTSLSTLFAQDARASIRDGWPPNSDLLDLYSLAETAYEAGDYPTAIRLYGRLLDFPTEGTGSISMADRAGLHVRLAESHLQASQPRAALEVLNRARRQPGVSERRLLFYRARAHMLLKQPEQSMEYIDALLENSRAVYAEYPELWRKSHELRLDTLQDPRGSEALFSDLSAPWYTRVISELELRAARELYREQRYGELASWLDSRFSRFEQLSASRELQLLRGEAFYFLMDDPGVARAPAAAEVISIFESLRNRVDEFTPIIYVRLFNLYSSRPDAGENSVSDLLKTAENDLEAHPDILAAFYERMLADRFPRGEGESIRQIISRLDRLGTEYQSYITPYYTALTLLENESDGGIDAARQVIRAYQREGGEGNPWLDVLLSELDYRQGDFTQSWQRLENLVPGETLPGAPSSIEDFRIQRLEIMLYSLYSAGEFSRSASLGSEHVEEYPRFRPVTARAYAGMGEYARAAEILEPLFSTHSQISPNDGLRSEYYQYLVKLGRWTAIISRHRSFSPDNPEDFPASRYLYGLALVQTGRFEQAVEIFHELSGGNPGAELEIYADYYLGWASFRSSQDQTAVQAYERLVKRLLNDSPRIGENGVSSSSSGSTELFVRAAYEGAWAALRLGEYPRGLTLLASVLNSPVSRELQEMGLQSKAGDTYSRALYLRAKLLMLQRKPEDAANALMDFRDLYPRHDLADEALLDYARVRASQGQVNRAVRSLYELISAYPDNQNAALAAYRIGELYYQNGRFEEAREAFNSYRNEYPRDGNVDAALYFSGRASWQSGEAAAARLYWNNLVENFPRSYFRLNTMLLLAELYVEQGRASLATELYDRIESEYPGQASNLDIESLRAALSTGSPGDDFPSVLESDPGLSRQASRNRVLELGKTMIIDQAGISQRSRDLEPYLETLSVHGDASPRQRSRALYYLGRAALQRAEYSRAAEYFIDAALSNSSDRQRAPEYLYFALESYSRQGADQEALAVYQQMTEIYPDSSWTEDGRRAIRRYIPGALSPGGNS